jgi:MoaA/NifB/PqqE/SkfB family radical SAM enzyme
MDINDLRNSQIQPVTDLMSTLQSIEINPSEMCNRTCSFCPRSDSKIYKNQKTFISTETCKIIAEQLNAINFSGRVGFVGFGEPLLHPQLSECVSILSKTPAKWIEVNTNGDFLTKNLAKSLVDAGCTHLTISMYDEDRTEYFNSMLDGIGINIVYRHQYNADHNYNLNIVNRIDITKGKTPLSISRSCYLPFYKLFIDWNGDFLLCQQDWARYTGNQYNISTTSLKDFWLNRINKYRTPLISNDRSVYSPCNHCDINGTTRGKSSFDLIKHHLAQGLSPEI